MKEFSGPKPEWCLDKKRKKFVLNMTFRKFYCKLKEVKKVGNFRIIFILVFVKKNYITTFFHSVGKLSLSKKFRKANLSRCTIDPTHSIIIYTEVPSWPWAL